MCVYKTRCTCYIVRRLTSTLLLVCFFLIPRSLQSPDPVRIQIRWSLQSPDPVLIQIRWSLQSLDPVRIQIRWSLQSLYPVHNQDQMVAPHLETTSTALKRQRSLGHLDEPPETDPSEDSSPRQLSGKDHWNQWSPYNLTLLAVGTNYWFVWFVFFLRSVTDGLLVPCRCRLWLA